MKRGVCCHFLLQGIFPTQGSNPRPLHWQADSLPLTLWTVARQAPLSMGFPRQEYWSGLPVPPSGDLPHTGIKPTSPALQVDSLPVGSLFPLLEDRSLVFRSEKGFMEYSFFSKRLSTSPYFLPHRYHSLRKDTVSQIHEYF